MKSDKILTSLVPGHRELEVLLSHVGASNPFCTAEYGKAMHALGRQVWVVGFQSGSHGPDVGLGCITKGRLSVELEFPSLPQIARDKRFWDLVDLLCERVGVTDITADSFGSMPVELPHLRGEVSRVTRYEFLLRLGATDPAPLLSANHKRSIKKATKCGMAIRRTRSILESLSDHVALISQSAQRRLTRGESVSVNTNLTSYRALLDNGAAELFQAVLGSHVLSSVLVLLSPRAGYYHSAGTSMEGMDSGASHFLIYSIGHMLKDEGREVFNLGGAPDGSSLARFKAGFGGERIALPAARCYVGAPWKKKLRSAIRVVRSDREHLVRVLTGSRSRLLVFRIETETAIAGPLAPLSDMRLEPLTEEQLATLPCPVDDHDFRNRQLERLRRFRKSYAYAVKIGDTIAHVSWLLPSSVVASEVPAILELREDEAEITACETAPAFRGKGIYGYAIRRIAKLAHDQGIRRIYMKTLETNVASQSGIRKAGLTPIGSVSLIRPPFAPSKTVVRRTLEP